MSIPLTRRSPPRVKTSFVFYLSTFVLLFAGPSGRLEVASAQSSPGSISFTQSSISVNENAGSATITLTRTGGSSGRVVGKVGLTDVTTSPADYVFKPGTPDLTFPSQQFNYSFFGTQSIALQ